VTITGKVLRILLFKVVNAGNTAKEVVNLIISDKFDYMRVSFWDDKAEQVRSGEIKTGDVLSMANASVSKVRAEGEKRAHIGQKYSPSSLFFISGSNKSL